MTNLAFFESFCLRANTPTLARKIKIKSSEKSSRLLRFPFAMFIWYGDICLTIGVAE
tara:strand:- start:576 stop:746 length:171 start_codon:yes stop_codon:yes gene_type:complete